MVFFNIYIDVHITEDRCYVSTRLDAIKEKNRAHWCCIMQRALGNVLMANDIALAKSKKHKHEQEEVVEERLCKRCRFIDDEASEADSAEEEEEGRFEYESYDMVL